jgi:hypothetical protein
MYTDYDSNNSLSIGRQAEAQFQAVMNKQGYNLRRSNQRQETVAHIDFISYSGNTQTSYEIKASKRLARGSDIQDDYIWIELKNRFGFKGWLFGKADFFCFQVSDGFLIVAGNRLRKLVAEKIQSRWVFNPSMALYCHYSQRNCPLTDLTLLKKSDVVSISTFMKGV